MSRLVFDIETDGLYNQVTTIWCISIKDVGTGVNDIYNFTEGKNVIEETLDRLEKADELIGHNIRGYDIPVIKKLYPNFTPSGKIIDTLVLSRLISPDREGVIDENGKSVHGRHSLKSWGIRLGIHKGEHNDWTKCTPEMLKYCKQDVEVTHALWIRMVKDMKEYNWLKPIALEEKVQDIITQQEINGWKFDKSAALKLARKMSTISDKLEREIVNSIPRKCVIVATVNKPFKINGELSSQALKYIDESEKSYIKGPFSVIKYESINLQSPSQVKDLLYSQGWVPDEWNLKKDKRHKPIRNEDGSYTKTTPKITDTSLEPLNTPLGTNFKLLSKTKKRLQLVNGLIEHVREDGRVSAECNTNGTNTGRMTHKVVTNIPKAKDDVLYGKECRELFIVPDDKILVGCDAAGLEFRMLAHYMNDNEYIETVITGDIHTFTMRLIPEVSTRDNAKTFGYGLIYGAGNLKTGLIIGGTEAEGKRLKEKFLKGLPALERLNIKVKEAAKRGYLKGLDGRKLPIRNAYSALNLLLQSAGAITMKVALVILDKSLKCAKLDTKIIGNFHDEFEIECNPEDVDKVKKIAEDSIKKAGEYFKLRCPLKGEAKIGKNWAEVH